MKKTGLLNAIGIISLIGTSSGYATDYTWQGGSGLFSDTAMWSPTGSPSDGDRAKFSTTTEGTVSWTGDVSNNEMQIIQTTGNELALDLSGYTYTLTNRFTFDGSKASSYVVISNGVLATSIPTNTSEIKINANVAPARLTFGDKLTATLPHFTFYRSEVNVATGAVVTFNGECKVNESIMGYQALNILGGDVICNNHFKCPNNGMAGSTSVLNIASGSLVAKQYFSVGDKGGVNSVGILNMSGGYLETWATIWLGNSGGACGIANVSGGKWMSKGAFEVSHREYTTAFLNMTGGEIELATGRYLGVAYAGGAPACDTGTVFMTGGRILATNVNCAVYVGAGSNCFGRCAVGGTGTILARDFYIASSAYSEGECMVTGGVISVGSTFSIGAGNPSLARLKIDGGTVTNLGSTYVGNGLNGQGAFTMGRGTLFVSNSLIIGNSLGSTGNALLTGGEINPNYLSIGNSGVGYWVQSNATVTVPIDVSIGINNTGTLEVVNGTITNYGTFYAGKNTKSLGQIILRNGTIYSAKGFRIGDWGGVGSLLLENGIILGGSGGTSSIGNGNGSTGSVIQTGGQFKIEQSLTVANSTPAAVGSYDLYDGQLIVTNDFVIANNPFNRGEVTVRGGSVWVGGNTRIGVGSNSIGTLTLSGGVYTNINYVDVGHAGTGTLNIAGGTLVTRVLRLVPYNYTNGTPTARINITGGLLHATNVMYCSDALFSTSIVTLAGGTLKIPQLWNNRGYSIIVADGGELEATRNDNAFINANLQELTLSANGLYVDSAGYTIATSRDLPDAPGEHGLFGKRGDGTFTLNANTTFTGPVVVEQGTLALGSSGLISLAGGCTVNGGALLNLSARALDFTLATDTLSRIDGEMRLASGKTVIVANGATLSGTGTIDRVVLEAGATFARMASDAETMRINTLDIPTGANVALTGYTLQDLRNGVAVATVSAATVSRTCTVTLNGVPIQTPLAFRTDNTVLTVFSYNPGTIIRVF